MGNAANHLPGTAWCDVCDSDGIEIRRAWGWTCVCRECFDNRPDDPSLNDGWAWDDLQIVDDNRCEDMHGDVRACMSCKIKSDVDDMHFVSGPDEYECKSCHAKSEAEAEQEFGWLRGASAAAAGSREGMERELRNARRDGAK